MEYLSIIAVLGISTLLSIVSTSTTRTVSVTMESRCGNTENCQQNCRSSIKVDGKDLAMKHTGIVFNMVVIEPHNDGKTSHFHITFDNSLHVANQTHNFLANIANNSVIIILSQGCLFVDKEDTKLIKEYVPGIEKWLGYLNVNAMVGCKGTCTVKEYEHSANEHKFHRIIEIPVTSNKPPIPTTISTTTTRDPTNAATHFTDAGVDDDIAADKKLNFSVVCGVVAGVVASFFAVLLYICYRKRGSTEGQRTGYDNTVKREEKEILKKSIDVIYDQEDNHVLRVV